MPWVWLGFVVVMAGCHRAPTKSIEESAPPVATRSSGQNTADAASVLPLRRLGEVPESVQPDSSVAEESEAESALALSQLKKLGDYFLQRDTVREEEVAWLVTNDCQVARLTPEALNSLYDGEPFQIQTGEFRDQAMIGSGPVALATSLNDILRSFEPYPNKRSTQFKIDAVSRSQQTVTTNVRGRISGESGAATRQINLIWTCTWRKSEDSLKLEKIEATEFEVVTATHPKANRFWSDVTWSAIGASPAFAQLQHGLDHWLDRMEQNADILATGYQGLAIGDVNGDGLDDVFLPQPGGVLSGLPNRLLIQNQDGSVTDQAAEFGVDWLNETHSGLFVDIDNDGDQDLVVGTSLGVVFLENWEGRELKARVAKLLPESPPMSLAAADYDLDGDLDFFVCCYSRRSSSQLLGRPLPYHDANNGGRNVLFRNESNWNFRNVTREVGLDQNNRRFSFAAVWEDFDRDGDADLYVANDYGRNCLYLNQQGHFQDAAGALGVEDISAGMSVTSADVNQDGWFDIYVSNMWSSAGNRVAFQRSFLAGKDQQVLHEYQRHARGNSLFLNHFGSDVPTAFTDVSEAAKVTMGRWAWSSQFADINNDGWQDLLIANGFITQERTDDL